MTRLSLNYPQATTLGTKILARTPHGCRTYGATYFGSYRIAKTRQAFMTEGERIDLWERRIHQEHAILSEVYLQVTGFNKMFESINNGHGALERNRVRLDIERAYTILCNPLAERSYRRSVDMRNSIHAPVHFQIRWGVRSSEQ